jgi:hypothetical protein
MTRASRGPPDMAAASRAGGRDLVTAMAVLLVALLPLVLAGAADASRTVGAHLEFVAAAGVIAAWARSGVRNENPRPGYPAAFTPDTTPRVTTAASSSRAASQLHAFFHRR